MRKFYLAIVGGIFCLSLTSSATLVIVNFDDLPKDHVISGNTIDGILWDYSSEPGLSFYPGSWITHGYNPSGTTPENNYLTNNFGCTKISFRFTEDSFPDGAMVLGAHFAGYGNQNIWPAAITVSGLWEETEAWSVSLSGITADLQWLAMDGSKPVDTVVVSVTPKAPYDPIFNEYGYFGMDNLRYEQVIVPEPITLLLLALGSTVLGRRK